MQGSVVLQRLGGTAEVLPGVKVWAYSEGGELYETFTDQNGEFRFYNMPATSLGTEYLIYAEYYIVDSFDSTQVETLAANTSIRLDTSHTDANPFVVALDLFTIIP